jgi:2-polyprenyl-3-methyl-5-hydroxy-6-metoxy-1,4-benzoquinol methylase
VQKHFVASRDAVPAGACIVTGRAFRKRQPCPHRPLRLNQPRLRLQAVQINAADSFISPAPCTSRPSQAYHTRLACLYCHERRRRHCLQANWPGLEQKADRLSDMNRPPLPLQQSFWNTWNAANREEAITDVSREQAAVVLAWLARMGRSDLKILEVGCGTGWLCGQLLPFGEVTGTDLSDQVLERAAKRSPATRFIPGDFMALAFEPAHFDVVVTLEVLSHVADQPAFLKKISSLLTPGGTLMLATQNKPALQRNEIPPPMPGQMRRWVDRRELAQLLNEEFFVEELFSITPRFNRGVLRIANARKLRALAGLAGLSFATSALKKAQERAWLGWTLMALARKRT